VLNKPVALDVILVIRFPSGHKGGAHSEAVALADTKQ
jgi:hypothetical protein